MKRYFLTYCLLMVLLNQSMADATLLGDNLVTNDTFYVQTSSCSTPSNVCIDIPMADINDYDFTVNGVSYTGGFSACSAIGASHYDYSTLFGQGNLGPYAVNDWDVGGNLYSGNFFTISDLVDSMNLWNPSGNWTLDVSSLSIFGGNPNLTYSQMDVTVVAINSPTFIAWSTGAVTAGTELKFPPGIHTVIVNQTSGGICVDTFLVESYCVITTTVDETIEENNTGMYCFDVSELPGQVSSVQMLCPSSSGTFANFQLIANNSCVEYNALSPGLDSSCFVICDNFGICDTTILRVTVTEGPFVSGVEWLSSTIYVGLLDSQCIDTTQLAGNVMSIINDCPTSSGSEVAFNINTTSYCVNYSALDVGVDTACIQVIDDLGNVDTTYLVVTVLTTTTDYIYDTLEVGMLDSFCLINPELVGNFMSFENICEDSTSSGVIFTLNSLSLCINAQADSVGIDTACIVICDDLGICDSTYLILTVMDTITIIPSKPIANNDTSSVLFNEDIVINICENDVIPNAFLTNNYILPITSGGVGPNYGFAIFNDDCTILYTPVGEPCDVEDSFEYVICNAAGCDTALVTVTINCEEESPVEPLMFTNGFSPNDDDVNDFFKIVGAETLIGSELNVFNRWGNEVFTAKGYQNDWNGTWNGSVLEDGTYFYVFDDGQGNEYAGYVYIRR